MREFSWVEKSLMALVFLVGSSAIFVNVMEVPVWKMILERKFKVSTIVDSFKREPIGKVLKIKGDIDLSRKKHEQYSYDQLSVADLIYDKDFIVNGSGVTTIQLNTGEIFELLPSTSIVINALSDQKMSTEVFRSAKIEVLSGIVESAEPQIKVVEKIKYVEAEPKIVEVEKIKLVERPLDLLADLNLEDPLVAGEINAKSNRLSKVMPRFYVDLKWGGDERANKYEIQYSWNDKDFKTLVTTENSFYRSFEEQVFSGRVFFKVLAYKDDKFINQSKTKALSFFFQSPSLTEPANKHVFHGKIYLTWAKTSFTKDYALEISSKEDFENAREIEIKDNFFEGTLPPGKYFWRVRSQSWSKISSFSETRSFDVESVMAGNK